MAIELRWTKTAANPAAEPVGLVELFVGDAGNAESSQQCISARVSVDDTNVKSLALLQIAALRKARDLLTDESERLGNLYHESERPRR